MSDATFYDRNNNSIYQFIKPFLDKKKSHTIFEEYKAFSFDVLFAIVFVFGCRKNCI